MLTLTIDLNTRGVLKEQNRTKALFPNFNLENFFNKDYQAQIEEALIDRVIFNDELNSVKSRLDTFLVQKINRDKLGYKVAVKDYFFYNNEDYLVHKASPIILPESSYLNAESYNNIDCENKYLYYIDDSDNVNFDNNANYNYDDIVKLYNTFKTQHFKINNYEEYKKYFYKTDYHWNDIGSYKGYTEIMDLIKSEDHDEIRIPTRRIKWDDNFQGNIAKSRQYFYITEDFYYQKFNLPKHRIFFGEREVSRIGTWRYEDDYAAIYDWARSEVIYDYNNPEEDNLLIISNCYATAVAELVASHYNKTYFVDPRLYGDFYANDYIKKNNINNVLVIGTVSFFNFEDIRLEG